MAKVRIGHASNPYDSGPRQVTISDYYDGEWTLLLRPTEEALASKSALICEACCNNNNILYSQASRHTLKTAALKAAGLSNDNKNISKLEVKDIEKISTICYADCSSLMTLCAIAGGANFSYGDNATVTWTMGSRFVEGGSYKAYESAKYLTSSDYLKRGDILVNAGHTVMVLDNGSEAGVWTEPLETVSSTKIVARASEIGTTSAKIAVKILSIEGKKETASKKEDLNLYNWAYTLKSLKTSKETKDVELKIGSANETLLLDGLEPMDYYTVQITAKEKSGKNKLVSSKIIFSTLPAYPKAVKNLKVVFNNKKQISDSFVISFSSPDWGVARLQHCYRLFLIINGKAVAYSDTIIAAASSCKNKEIKLSSIAKTPPTITYNDVVQVGVLPGLIDDNEFIFDCAALRCSIPFYVKNYLTIIDKILIRVKDVYKRVIIYNNLVDKE